jgi:uncharacterized protein
MGVQFMRQLNIQDETMREILTRAKTIALVGHSDKTFRISYKIAEYLRKQGYRVYPVNPTVEEIDGEISYPSLADIPEKIDIVNIFRRSEHIAHIVEEAIQAQAYSIWTQLRVIDTRAGARALESGIMVIMNRCIKVEHARLLINV